VKLESVDVPLAGGEDTSAVSVHAKQTARSKSKRAKAA
jgi:hypothetical protein